MLLLSTFSYEAVERRLQSYVENLWIGLDDKRRAVGSHYTRVVRGLAIGIGLFLERLFGRAAVSWQAIAVSVLLALAAYDLNYAFAWPPPRSSTWLWGACAQVALASLPVVHPRLAVITIGALLAILAQILITGIRGMVELVEAGRLPTASWLLWLAAIAISFVLALLVLWFERRLLRWLSDGPSLVRALTSVLACGAAIGVIVVGPMLLASMVRRDPARSPRAARAVEEQLVYGASSVRNANHDRAPQLGAQRVSESEGTVETLSRRPHGQLTMRESQPPFVRTLEDLAVMNFFTALPLLLLLFGAASLAIHYALWEIVLRPVYEVQRAGYRAAARTVGVACLLYGLRVSDGLLSALLGR